MLFPHSRLEEIFAPVAHLGHLALAVSGGSDSMALLHLAHAWGRARKLSVLSVDHGLRAASGHEVQTVARWCMALGIAHVSLAWMGAKPATGIQAAAREARYRLMGDWISQHGAQALLTGHTRDDQAETVLMRQARTLSPDALAGIAPRREMAWGALVRPLLDVPRDELQKYLRAAGQDWLVDPSNRDERFERVRVRRALHNRPDERDRLAMLARSAQDQSASETAVALEWLKDNVRHDPLGFGSFAISALDSIDGAAGARALGILATRYGSGTPLPPPLRQRILHWLQLECTAGQTAGGARFVRRRALCLVGREAGRIAKEPVLVPETGSVLWDGRFRVTAPPGSCVVRCTMKNRGRNPKIPAFVWETLPDLAGVQSLERCSLPYSIFLR